MQYRFLTVSALVAGASATSFPNYLGFNSGSSKADGSAKFQSDFEQEMNTAQNLKGAPGNFNAVRLYTNIQSYTTSDPIQAFPAAIATNTSLLLGIWASGTTSIQNEIAALKAGLAAHGTDLADRIIGVSIGSEDLYRNSATGVTNKAGIGADPDVIVGFIKDFKTAFADTALKDVSIGHVDTWDAYTNGSNKAVIDAVDWLGIDEYPYYQTGDGNKIENAASLFMEAYDKVVAIAGSKDVWVTETGWPYTGPDWDEAVASVANAKTYWDDVGCDNLFGNVPTFWYNLVEDSATNEMSFAITKDLSTTPLFDLSCPAKSKSTTTSKSGAKSTASSSSAAATASEDSTGKKASGSTTTSSSDSTATGSSDSSSSASSTAKSGSSSTASSASSSSTSDVAASGASAAKLGSSAFAAIAFVAAAFALF
ncbi:putative glucan endo-1,3-beta-glucosidase eglC [Cytospora mali]|uniref:Glucan endo-1,3-beta-glucosidase eglC n=1 Tax=Cytospora mali TaxID=578113 RepID=A0A194US17_CYTMA|nr:putative glucan endo-1,3-beta-glucosidase eglC [Valsa mali var. pyri (nom. inval.)]